MASGQALFDEEFLDENKHRTYWILPGAGRSPAYCEPFFFGVCPNSDCGMPSVSAGNCGSSRCPSCSTSWRYERTKSAAFRLLLYAKKNGARIDHYTLSPPPSRAAGEPSRKEAAKRTFSNLIENSREEEFPRLNRDGSPVIMPEDVDEIADLRREANKIAKRKVKGGVVVFHPLRLLRELPADECDRYFKNCEGCPYAKLGDCKYFELKERAKEEGDWEPGEFGMWAFLSTLDNWTDYVYWSPHFHVIGVLPGNARWRQGGKAEDKGWVWKHLGRLNGSRSKRSPTENTVSVLMYLLSHAGISTRKRFHSVTYFGKVHQAVFSTHILKTSVRWVKYREVEKELDETLGRFSEKNNEKMHGRDCSHCGFKLIEISNVRAFARNANISTKFRKYLESCYRYSTGTIPPPRAAATNPEAFRDQLGYMG